jgi:hypothetical protein
MRQGRYLAPSPTNKIYKYSTRSCIYIYMCVCVCVCVFHCVGLLDVQNILSADTGIFRQTEGHSFGDHLISESVSVTPSSVIEASIMLCSVSLWLVWVSVPVSSQPALLTPDSILRFMYAHQNIISTHIINMILWNKIIGYSYIIYVHALC